MPTRALRACARPGCAETTAERYCPRHRPADDRANSAARGYGGHWRKLRLFVLAREPLCRRCLARGRTVAATDVDHIKPRADGGSDATENLQALCHSCHSQKTVREDGGFGVWSSTS
jgi:5-methylcytosine-specific restriction protein A